MSSSRLSATPNEGCVSVTQPSFVAQLFCEVRMDRHKANLTPTTLDWSGVEHHARFQICVTLDSNSCNKTSVFKLFHMSPQPGPHLPEPD